MHMRGQALTAASGFVPGFYTYWFLNRSVPHQQALAWCIALFVIDILTVAHAVAYFRRPREWPSLKRWRMRQVALQSAASAIWGIPMVWAAYQPEVSDFVFMVLVAVGSIGVMGIMHYHSAVLGYSICIWLVTAALLAMGKTLDAQILVGIPVLLFSINFYMWESSANTRSALINRYRADALATSLAAIAEKNLLLATRDELTGLLNRRTSLNSLDDIHASTAYTLLLVDVDHFKQVNDCHGHLVGDEVLRAVAQRMTCSIRPGDILARIGGEEFMVILATDETDPARAGVRGLRSADRLRLTVCDTPVPTQAGPLSISVSVGVAHSTQADTALGVFALADRALYDAKSAGRNRVHSTS